MKTDQLRGDRGSGGEGQRESGRHRGIQTGRSRGNDTQSRKRSQRERATQRQKERRILNSEERDRRASRGQKLRRGRDRSLGPRRRRHPQRTLRIRHGFASFGRYYFAPEKKINTKKVWILSGDKSFSVWRGWGGGGRGNAEQMRPVASWSPGPGLGRGCRPPPRSPPGSAAAAHASPASEFTPPREPRDARGTARDPLGSARTAPAQTLPPRNAAFLSAGDSARILQLRVVQRSASFCPRKCGLGLGSPRWVFGAQWT